MKEQVNRIKTVSELLHINDKICSEFTRPPRKLI